ncbi:MAG: TRAP transporter permease [Rhodospirillales bacterium]|jgi:TRAP transporter 4TM/12TM fusion protein|nr:TRAP transporter permease [Rhodospirillales bacterium]
MSEKAGASVVPEAAAGSGIIDFDKLGEQQAPARLTRAITGRWAQLVLVVCTVSSLFHLYTGGYQVLPAMQQRPIHLAFMLFLTFLLYPPTRKGRDQSIGWPDFIVATVAAVSSAYVAYNYEAIVRRHGVAEDYELYLGTLFCLFIFEACRRTIGSLLAALAAVFVAYAFVGPWLPGILQHGGFSFHRVVHQMYLSVEGIFGIAIGVSSTYVYLFILFGAFLNKSGTTKLFANLALAMAGHTPGGPAKVGVIASGLMGTIQGSSAANVAATGMFTIPLMKSIGLKRHFAAAVEAVASLGGMYLPPVMGSSAFIMAEYLNMPYGYVAAGATLPALLYYAAVYLQVHLRAKKEGLVGIPRNRLPALKLVVLQYGHLVLPIVILVGMMIMKFTVLFSAFFSIIAVVILSYLRRNTRMGLRKIIEALELGAINTLSTAIACAVVGYIVGGVGLTGLGLLFTQAIVNLAQGMILPTLLLAACASLFLSMGLPTTSVYIISATLVAPALIEVGVTPLAAHLFCYYWGGVSGITPPVALTAYVGAGIAGANVMKTGFTAMRLGIAAYLVPFYYVFWPSLIHWDQYPIFDVAMAVVGGVAAVICMAIIGERYLFRRVPMYKVLAAAVAIVLCLHPSGIVHLAGILLALFILVSEYVKQPERRWLRRGTTP